MQPNSVRIERSRDDPRAKRHVDGCLDLARHERTERSVRSPPPLPTIHCRFGKNDGIRPEVDILLNRHPGLDPGSTTSTPQWIPDQVRDDEGLKTTDSRREKTFHVAVSSHCFALPATPFFQNEIEIAPVSYGGSNASFCECSASND